MDARKPAWPDVPRDDDGRFKPRPTPAPKPKLEGGPIYVDPRQ